MSNRRREKWYWFLGFQYRFPRRRVWLWLLVTAPLSTVGIFLTIRDAVLPKVYGDVRIAEFLPSVYWYWHWYVIFALLYLLVFLLFVAPAANRVTLERQKERNDEKLRRYKGQLERTLTTAGAPPELSLDVLKKTYELVPLQPNLVHPIEGTIEEVHEGEHGVITRGHIKTGKNFQAVIATYENSPDTKPKRRIIGIDGVAAEVSYTSFGDGPTIRPHQGAWLSQRDRKIHFEVSGRRDLIVATLEGDDLNAVERETTGVNPEGITHRTKLTGDLFKVRIRLIDAFGTVLDDYEMMLTVNREPELIVELFSAGFWRLYRLRDLLQEGRDLVKNAYKLTIKYLNESLAVMKDGSTNLTDIRINEKEEETLLAAKAKEWEIRVGEFLGRHVSEAQKESFLSTKPSIDDGLNRVKKHPFDFLTRTGEKSEQKYNWTLLDSLKAREEELDKLVSKYRGY